MTAKCTICGGAIVLVPSATERAEKCGGSRVTYTRLFTSHSECFIAKREADTLELIRRINKTSGGGG